MGDGESRGMSEDSGQWQDGEPWSRLEVLAPFFAFPTPNVSEEVRALLESARELQPRLGRRERRIGFFGALKTGKSSLVNALLGAPVLPARANRATGVVTVVRHDRQASATLVRRGADGPIEQGIPVDDLGCAILLDLTGGSIRAPEGIQEVRIGVPLPFLEARCVLVDTPGLFEDETLAAASYGEMARTDLAVLVLAADKVLSARERETAAYIHDLLNGSVVFVLNRLDMVDEQDREEVLEWARRALEGSGNRLVGRPRIFAGTATDGKRGRDGDSLAGFERWLIEILESRVGDRIAAVSRLGILEQRLCRVEAGVRAELLAAQEIARQAGEEDAAALAREKEEIRGSITRGRARLQGCVDALGALGEAFVAECVDGTRRQISPSGERRATIRIPLEAALERYAEGVAEEVRVALAGVPTATPAFDLRSWIMRAEVEAATHPSSEIGAMFGDLMTRVVDGGNAGREAGASIGSWIGKSFFGVDLERETLRRAEQVARTTARSLRQEADRYLEMVDALLAEAERYYSEWTRTSPRVAAAEEVVRGYESLLGWCAEFLQEVRRLAAEIEG